MNLSPWYSVQHHGKPKRTGVYLFELWFENEIRAVCLETYAYFMVGCNRISTEDGRLIELMPDDHWRGILK